MKYHITDHQKDLARFLVGEVRAKRLSETFRAVEYSSGLYVPFLKVPPGKKVSARESYIIKWRLGALISVAESKLVILTDLVNDRCTCTLTGLIYEAVDTNFVSDDDKRPISTLAHFHPPEIAMSLDRLRTKYPDPKKLGFLIMRFTAAKPFHRIVEAIKQTAVSHGLEVIRADETEFHADLWGNVRTHLHGCGFGIAVYERIETNEPNANVGLEVGYLMAMNKPVLLLKDRTVPAIQSDLTGKLYRTFDPHDPEGTVPDQLTRWLEDNGIVVPKRS